MLWECYNQILAGVYFCELVVSFLYPSYSLRRADTDIIGFVKCAFVVFHNVEVALTELIIVSYRYFDVKSIAVNGHDKFVMPRGFSVTNVVILVFYCHCVSLRLAEIEDVI